MFKLKVTKAVAILSFSALLLGGCGSNDATSDNGSSTTQQDTTSNSKDELVVSFGMEPEGGFDPTTGWGRYGSPLFQSTLFRRDENMQVQNDLATEYTVSEDGLTWTVSIKEDVLFSDGESLNAEDVVYTYKTASESGSLVDLTNLKSVETVDDSTIVFNLNSPQSTFIGTLATVGIVPEHAHDENYGANPVGSGPLQMLQWDKGQQLIVEPNPNYYGEKPFFKKMTILFLEQDAAYAAAKAGQLDITAIPATMADQEVEGMDMLQLDSIDNRGIAYPYVPAGEETEEGYPIGNDVTSDIAIRKAIDMAIDRQELIDGIVNGYGTKGSSVADGMPWWNPETAVKDDGDVEGAKQLLDEAGWVVGDDGIREKDGVKAEFTLLYLASDKVRQSISIAVADAMKEIGISITPDGKGWDELEKEMHSSPILLGWGGYDPLEMYDIYHSSRGGVDYFNTGYYSNPTVDEYLDKALAATTEEEAMENWQKAQWDGETGFSAKGDVAWTWIMNIDHVYLVKEDLEIGEQKIQPHGHGWPITDSIINWERND